MFEEFKGKQLPPRPFGLETAVIRFGVSKKQKTTARLAFDKSATQAGYFSRGSDRLIEPIVPGAQPSATPPATPEPQAEAPAPTKTGGVKINYGPALHPFIRGLVDALPKEGELWPVEKRAKWLRAAANNFDLMYKGEGDIHITVVREPNEEARDQDPDREIPPD